MQRCERLVLAGLVAGLVIGACVVGRWAPPTVRAEEPAAIAQLRAELRAEVARAKADRDLLWVVQFEAGHKRHQQVRYIMRRMELEDRAKVRESVERRMETYRATFRGTPAEIAHKVRAEVARDVARAEHITSGK